MATQINERSRLPITIRFLDGNFVLCPPQIAKYRIDCQTTGQVILDWTTVPYGATVIVTVTPSQNAIIDDHNRFETKVMAVEANCELESQYVDSFTWKVKNLQGFT